MSPRDTAGGVVIRPDGKIVLVNQGSNVWSFPKGGIESGEDALTAARREILEECGIQDLNLICELGSYERYRISKGGVGEDVDAGLMKRTIFLFTTSQIKLTQDDKEIVGARWFTLDEALQTLTHPKDKEFLGSVRSVVEVEIAKMR